MPAPISGASLGLAGLDAEPVDTSAFARPQPERYASGGLIGRGGMGEIRSAHDARLGRTVAVKTAVEHDQQAVRQLVDEATLTARLVHPGIVAIYDAGCTEDGRPYYTMPIVHGRSLATAIEQTPWPERLKLVRHFLDACEAIAYAHDQDVLHRDLKPGNILVGRFGETVVVDWGLAGPVGDRPGGLIGTPGYMPPEQHRGQRLGPSADVFALGKTLYEILTGSSQALPEVDVPPELLAIVQRSTESAASARYPDGRALAQDVASWFEGRRVGAYRYRLSELVARVWAAHRLTVVAVMLAIVGISLSVAVGYHSTSAERARAQASARAAIAAREHAKDNLARAEVAQALDAIAQGSWPQAELLAAGALMHAPSAWARGVFARFDPATRPRLRHRWSTPQCSHLVVSTQGGHISCMFNGELRIAEVGVPWDAMDPLDVRGRPLALVGPGRGVVVDDPSSGLRLVPTSRGGRSTVLDEAHAGVHHVLANGSGAVAWITRASERWYQDGRSSVETTQWCETKGRSAPGVVGVRHDGLRVAICQNGAVYLRGADDSLGPRQLLRLPVSLGGPMILAFAQSPSGYAAVGMAGGDVVVIDVDRGRVVRTFANDGGTPFDITLTSSRLALSDGHDGVYVWEVSTGALLVRLAARRAYVRWIDGGTRLQVVGDDVEQWDLSPAPSRPHLHATGVGIAALSISPDGRYVATAHGDGRLRLARLGQARGIAEIPLHWSVVKDVEFSPDGQHVVAVCAQDPQLHVLDLDDMAYVRRSPATAGRRAVWLDDELVLVAGYRPALDSWRDGTRVPGVLPEHHAGFVDLETDADRRGVTMLDSSGGVYRLGAEVGATARLVVSRPGATAVAGNEHMVVVLGDAVLETISTEGQCRQAPLPSPHATDLAMSADGRWLAVGHDDGR
ncbi:MAG: protein kinase, partial [Deltaproteobacteria bacterium]|nr:protein kinase [Deltaproteobacteria bacterium]